MHAFAVDREMFHKRKELPSFIEEDANFITRLPQQRDTHRHLLGRWNGAKWHCNDMTRLRGEENILPDIVILCPLIVAHQGFVENTNLVIDQTHCIVHQFLCL